MKTKISIITIFLAILPLQLSMAQEAKFLLPATVASPISLLDNKSTWLLSSNGEKLFGFRSIQGGDFRAVNCDLGGLAFSDLRCLRSLNASGDGLAIFQARVSGIDGLYAIAPDGSSLRVLFHLPIFAAPARGLSLGASGHCVTGPGSFRSFVSIGIILHTVDWSSHSGVLSAQSLELPFEPQGLAVAPGWLDARPRLLAWRNDESGLRWAVVVDEMVSMQGVVPNFAAEMAFARADGNGTALAFAKGDKICVVNSAGIPSFAQAPAHVSEVCARSDAFWVLAGKPGQEQKLMALRDDQLTLLRVCQPGQRCYSVANGSPNGQWIEIEANGSARELRPNGQGGALSLRWLNLSVEGWRESERFDDDTASIPIIIRNGAEK